MSTEGQKNPEPEPSPSSDNTPSDTSPDEERKFKEEGGKSSVPDTPSDKASPDDPPAAKAPEGAKLAGDVDICGTKIIPRYNNLYYYDSVSSDDDDDDEVMEFDESWIDSYSDESNPHWIAIRDACGVVMNKARIAVANNKWHSKMTGCKVDTKRLDRLTSQLTALGEDLEELVAVTTPPTMFPGCDVSSLSKLIRFLSETGIGEVRGRIDVEMLVSIYKAYRSERREMLGEMTNSQKNARERLEVWEKYKGAFVGFYKDTKNLQKTKGRWGDVGMSEKDLLKWNEEMRKLAETAKRLLRNVRGIVEPLISELGIYLDKKRELKKELAGFLDIVVPTVNRKEIRLVYG